MNSTFRHATDLLQLPSKNLWSCNRWTHEKKKADFIKSGQEHTWSECLSFYRVIVLEVLVGFIVMTFLVYLRL